MIDFFFLTCSVIYLFVEFFYARFALITNLVNASRLSSEFIGTITPTIKPAYFPIELIAQRFLVIELIIIVPLCVAGFFFLLFKRKSRAVDKAILLAGIVWSASGLFLFTLSSRAIPLAFLPICLGVPYLFQTKFKPIVIGFLLVLLIMFTFIPIHLAFYNQVVSYQTKEAYNADNFFIDHYDYSNHSLILASLTTRDYLSTRLAGSTGLTIYTPVESDLGHMESANMVLYNFALQNELHNENYTIEKVINGEKVNTVYDNGFSKIILKSYNFTQLPP